MNDVDDFLCRELRKISERMKANEEHINEFVRRKMLEIEYSRMAMKNAKLPIQ